jgi:hypothetical protein
MADDKERTQRRVYVLPTELVDRIVAFQNEMGLSSEVEAARRLLDEALKHRDDAFAIIRRFQERLKDTKLMSDIARDVLLGHPLVKQIGIENDRINFSLASGDEILISKDGSARWNDKHGQSTHLDKDGKDESIPF